jgi:PAS domain S-box-containing protein
VARETVIEKMGDGVIVVDIKERLVDFNPMSEQIFGRKASEAIGLPLQQILADNYTNLPKLAEKEEGRLEITINTAKDSRNYDVHYSSLYNNRGDKTGYLLLVTDITERKRAEQEREKLIKALGEANDELKKMDKTKSEFLSVVTHDLKSPLNNVLGYTDSLMEGKVGELNPKLKEPLEIIKRQAINQGKMIDSLQDFTRLEFGDIKINPELFSLRTMVKELVEGVRPEAEKKQQGVEAMLPAEDVMINADKTMVERIIENLVSNSIKYTNEGGRIIVTLKSDGKIGRITIADNGIGIAQEHLGKIFEKFYMVDPVLAREKRSLGLGLNIVKNFVDMHHGKIWVESEGKGKGSQFIVELPLNS